MVGRSAEVTETIERRYVDVVALQEVRYKNEGVRKLREGDFEYKYCIGKKRPDRVVLV